MCRNHKNKNGFTLIELLVVIAIIGILASIILVNLGGVRNSAKDASIISTMSQLRSAGEVYRDSTATGEYRHNSGGTFYTICTPASTSVPTGTTAVDVNFRDVQRLRAAVGKLLGKTTLNYNNYMPCGSRPPATKKSYTMYVKLYDKDHYCVDSDGFAGRIGATTPIDGTNGYSVGVKCK